MSRDFKAEDLWAMIVRAMALRMWAAGSFGSIAMAWSASLAADLASVTEVDLDLVDRARERNWAPFMKWRWDSLDDEDRSFARPRLGSVLRK